MPRRREALIAITGVALVPLSAQSAETGNGDLLARALDPNPDLITYTASAVLVAELHAVVPIRKTLQGTVFYKKPVRKIVFRDVPPPLRRFAEIVQSTPTYEELSQQFNFSSKSDDGELTTYILVPKASDSRVRQLTVQVEDASALIRQGTWSYINGEQLTAKPTYERQDNAQLLSELAMRARFPGYNVDGTLHFSDYQLGVPVSL